MVFNLVPVTQCLTVLEAIPAKVRITTLAVTVTFLNCLEGQCCLQSLQDLS